MFSFHLLKPAVIIPLIQGKVGPFGSDGVMKTYPQNRGPSSPPTPTQPEREIHLARFRDNSADGETPLPLAGADLWPPHRRSD